MTRQCIVCGAWFKYDRSAIRHLTIVHCIPNDLFRLYVTKIDTTVPTNDDGDDDDVEVELVS